MGGKRSVVRLTDSNKRKKKNLENEYTLNSDTLLSVVGYLFTK